LRRPIPIIWSPDVLPAPGARWRGAGKGVYPWPGIPGQGPRCRGPIIFITAMRRGHIPSRPIVGTKTFRHGYPALQAGRVNLLLRHHTAYNAEKHRGALPSKRGFVHRPRPITVVQPPGPQIQVVNPRAAPAVGAAGEPISGTNFVGAVRQRSIFRASTSVFFDRFSNSLDHRYSSPGSNQVGFLSITTPLVWQSSPFTVSGLHRSSEMTTLPTR